MSHSCMRRMSHSYACVMPRDAALVWVCAMRRCWQVGERLGFGITLLLVSEAAKITVLAYVPVCGETLWVDQFLLVNFVFAALALLETCFVLFLAYHADDHLIPGAQALPRWVLITLASWLGMPKPSIVLKCSDGESVVGDLLLLFDFNHAANNKEDGNDYDNQAWLKANPLEPPPSSPPFILKVGGASKDAANEGDAQVGRLHGLNYSRLAQVRPLTAHDEIKLIFYENLFFQVDSDNNGYVTFDDMEKLLSFLAPR